MNSLIFRNRQLLGLSVAVFLAFTGIGMVVPVRVLYAQSRGASLAIIGAMASGFLVSNFLFQYPIGWCGDRWGARRVMIAGLLAQSVLSLLYVFVTDPLLFVVLRFADGIGSAAVLPTARALVAAAIPEDKQGEAYGTFGAFFNAGFLLGPALGGLVASAGYNTAFIGSTIFRFAGAVIVLLMVQADGKERREARKRAASVSRRLLFTKSLIGVYLLGFGDFFFLGFELTLMPLWLRHNLGASVTLIGLAYAVWAIPNVVVSPFSGRLSDRRRRSTLILLFGLIQVPLYAAYGLASEFAVVLVLFGVHGVIFSLVQPSVDAQLAASSPLDARARAQGIFGALGQVSAFIGANTLPFIYAVSFRLPFFVMAAVFGFCVAVGGTLVRLAEPLRPGVDRSQSMRLNAAE